MSTVGLREFHSFEAAGRRFLYLVPSAAVFALDDCSSAILDSLSSGPRAGGRHRPRAVAALRRRATVADTLAELQRVRALADTGGAGAAARRRSSR